MSTVRSIERRLYIRRQSDRDMASQLESVAGGEVPRHMEWNGIWTGYLAFIGFAILFDSFVFGIGFSRLNPARAGSLAGVGAGAIVWSVVVLLIATFIGSWVAGRTPRTSRQHGMMRGIVLWGLILATTLWVVGGAASVAIRGGAMSGTASVTGSGTTALQNVLQANGVTISNAEAAIIAGQWTAGNATGAASALASSGNMTTTRANSLLSQVPPVTAAGGASAALAVRASRRLFWGLFWISLIGLGCALLGSAVGAGGMEHLPRRSGPSVQQPV